MDNTPNRDESFQSLLKKIVNQNKAAGVLHALQVKYEKEMAGEDGDKREEQLDNIAEFLGSIERAVTGVDIKFDFTPVTNSLSNQTQVLNKILEESTLLRKITEGSLQFDRESALYRNTSGRAIESTVSGKQIPKGGYVDFETAADRLSGQNKRVQEANKITPLTTTSTGGVVGVKLRGGNQKAVTRTSKVAPEKDKLGFGNVFDLMESVASRISGIADQMFANTPRPFDPAITSATKKTPFSNNLESDNIDSGEEQIVDNLKSANKLSVQANKVLLDQLTILTTLKESLVSKTPAELTTEKSIPSTPVVAGTESTSSLPGIDVNLPGIPNQRKPTPTNASKSNTSRVLKFGGAAAAIGLGAYAAYKGIETVEATKNDKLMEIQVQLERGDITPEQAAIARKEIGNSATKEKNAVVGESAGGVGGALAGGLAGAKIGGTIGTMFGPVGAVIGAGAGGLVGGAAGALAGTSAGKYVGERVSGWYDSTKNFISSQPKKDTPGASLYQTAVENSEIMRDLSSMQSNNITPIVTSNTNNNNSTSFVPIKASPRPERTGSALDRYYDKVSVY